MIPLKIIRLVGISSCLLIVKSFAAGIDNLAAPDSSVFIQALIRILTSPDLHTLPAIEAAHNSASFMGNSTVASAGAALNEQDPSEDIEGSAAPTYNSTGRKRFSEEAPEECPLKKIKTEEAQPEDSLGEFDCNDAAQNTEQAFTDSDDYFVVLSRDGREALRVYRPGLERIYEEYVRERQEERREIQEEEREIQEEEREIQEEERKRQEKRRQRKESKERLTRELNFK